MVTVVTPETKSAINRRFTVGFYYSQNDLGGHTKFAINVARELTNYGVQSIHFVPFMTHFWYHRALVWPKVPLHQRWPAYLRSQLIMEIRYRRLRWRGHLIDPHATTERFLWSLNTSRWAHVDFWILGGHWQYSEIAAAGMNNPQKIINVIHHPHNDNPSEIHSEYKTPPFANVCDAILVAEQCRALGIRIDSTISLGVDITMFYPRLGTDHTQKQVGFFFYQHARKNPSLIRRAINELLSRRPDVAIHVFGNGYRGPVSPNIVIHENLLEKEYARLIRSLDVFVYISNQEGFGLPPLEAMACGVPVVASAVGALPEFIESGFDGFLLPTDSDAPNYINRVIELLDNPSLWANMSALARSKAQAWTWKRTAQGYADLFNRLSSTRSYFR